ncbi:hypothetical protein FHS49_001550 [Sphingobium boeckii]|uniref:MerR family transcriptional regulator n=2 Tax=Sphingobium boeckii TaxID=1082345 RepID=A0A7W9AHE1_9SPHN|nr:hypothetical protein [Sphingobium boeckii]
MIRQLEALRHGLRHAAACPAPSHMECPSFRRLMKSARANLERGGSPRNRFRRASPQY